MSTYRDLKNPRAGRLSSQKVQLFGLLGPIFRKVTSLLIHISLKNALFGPILGMEVDQGVSDLQNGFAKLRTWNAGIADRIPRNQIIA
jgi:hypothetical protein